MQKIEMGKSKKEVSESRLGDGGPTTNVSMMVVGLLGLVVAIALQGWALRKPGSALLFSKLMDGKPRIYYEDNHPIVDSLKPITNLDVPFKHAKVFTTANFDQEVLHHDDRITIVVFYDPRSQVFEDSWQHIDEAARLIHQDAEVGGGKVQMGVVNAGIDSWLAALYAPLQRTLDEVSEVRGSSFVFGRSTYYGFMTRLFAEGEIKRIYKGVYAPGALLNFARMNHQRRPSEFHSLAELDDYATIHRPMIYKCGGKDALFVSVMVNFQGKSFLAELNDDDCLAKCPSGINVIDRFGDRFCFEGQVDMDSVKLSTELRTFLYRKTRLQLDQLTSQTVQWYVGDLPGIVVLMLNPEELNEFHYLQELVHEVLTTNPRLAKFKDKIGVLWSNAKVRGELYGLVEEEDIPNVIIFRSSRLEEGTHDEIYRQPYVVHQKPIGLLDEDREAVKEQLGEWFREIFAERMGLFERNHRDFIQQRKDSAVEPPVDAAEVLSASDAKNKEEKKQASLSRGKSLLDRLNEVNQDNPSTKTWELYQFSRTMHEFASLGMEDVYGVFEYLYATYVELEEAYYMMDDQKKAEETALVNQLNMIRNYFDQHPFLHSYVQTMPLSPKHLFDTIVTKNERAQFYRAIERLDAKRVGMFNRAHENVNHDKQAVVSQWAEAAHFLEYAIYDTTKSREKQFKEELASKQQTVLSIDVRSANELTLEEFYNKYAKAGKPVIIRDGKLFKEKWDLAFLKKTCGNSTVSPVKLDRAKRSWGGLVKATDGPISLAEFIDTFRTVEERKGWYVHDWSLPRDCPQIFGGSPYDGFIFPKYFAGDYFQRVPFEGYQHTWPSLFIGANGTQSLMHIDSGGTNFWMYLISGKKEWRFFERKDIMNLYKVPMTTHFAVDVFNPNREKFPLFYKAKMYQGIQEPGDLIFIPGGSPHGVRNLDDIIGVSMNYVDDSNIWLYLWTKLLSASYREFETMIHKQFPRGLCKNQTDLPFGQYKSTDWYKLFKQNALDLM